MHLHSHQPENLYTKENCKKFTPLHSITNDKRSDFRSRE